MKISITESQLNYLKKLHRLGLLEQTDKVSISENIETELDADEVDLSSFKPQEHLTDKLWNGDELDSKVRLQLLDIADDFIEFLGFEDIKYEDIVLTGSICNFNWSEQSDIDVHIIYDLSKVSENTELIRAYVDAKKNEWNEMHDNLTIYGFNVELYVESVDESAVSKGIYSLEKNEWLQRPNKNNIKLSKEDTISDIASTIATMIETLEDCYDVCETDSDLEELQNDVDNLLKTIHSMRKKQLKSGGEMSIGNIVYKFLRREEYLDRLYDLQNTIYDRLNSI